jgi:hypothetical protein
LLTKKKRILIFFCSFAIQLIVKKPIIQQNGGLELKYNDTGSHVICSMNRISTKSDIHRTVINQLPHFIFLVMKTEYAICMLANHAFHLHKDSNQPVRVELYNSTSLVMGQMTILPSECALPLTFDLWEINKKNSTAGGWLHCCCHQLEMIESILSYAATMKKRAAPIWPSSRQIEFWCDTCTREHLKPTLCQLYFTSASNVSAAMGWSHTRDTSII